MIHDKVCESQKLNSVSFEASELWFRLLTVVDDNGNYYADSLRVYANLMSEKQGATMESTDLALKALAKSGLIIIYKADKRSYLHLADFDKHQNLRKDLAADVSHPLNPSETGPAYTDNGKRRDSCVRPRTDPERAVTEPNGDETESRFEVEVKGEVEGKDQAGTIIESSEDELPEDLGDWPQFGKDFHRAAGGVKTFMKFEQNLETYQELCRKWGSDKVHAVISEWVDLKGGREKTKRSEYAAKNFLQDAEALMQQKIDEEVDANGVPAAIACIPGITRISEKNMR